MIVANTMQTSRLVSFDLLKLLAIYLVILGHSVQYLIPSHPYDESMYVYIYSFHMPLFMMVSGYFSYKKEITIKGALGGVKKRLFQLIVPCALWSVVHFLIVRFFLQEESMKLNDILIDEIFNTLWFLKSLFICYVAYVCLAVIKKEYRKLLLFVLIVVVPFIGWFHLKLMFPSFFIGILLRKYALVDKFRYVTTIVVGMFFAFLLLMWSADFFKSPAGTFSELIFGNFVPMSIYLYRYCISLTIGVCGALFFIYIFYNIFIGVQNNKMIIELSKYGQLTLGVYVLQTILLETILPHYFQISIRQGIGYYVLLPVCALVILIVCLILTKLIMKCKITNEFLLGNLVLK